jgi:hypothetical protein
LVDINPINMVMAIINPDTIAISHRLDSAAVTTMTRAQDFSITVMSDQERDTAIAACRTEHTGRTEPTPEADILEEDTDRDSEYVPHLTLRYPDVADHLQQAPRHSDGQD